MAFTVFFAWECIGGLFTLNLEYWFSAPFSLHQLISWALLILSIPLVLDGVSQLRRLGHADQNRVGAALYTFEKTTQLVTNGVYRYIRHPLYSSLVCLTWGIFFKHPAWAVLLLALAATAFLIETARIEEGENLRTFGEPYHAYMQHSKMFIPYLF